MDIRGGRDRRPGDRRPHRGPRAPRRPQLSHDLQQRVVVGAETAAGPSATAVSPYRPPPPPRLVPSPRLPMSQQPPPPRLLPPQTVLLPTPPPKSPVTEQPQTPTTEQPQTPTTEQPQQRLPVTAVPQPQQECRVRESGDGVEDCSGTVAGGSGAADETELLAKLRCPSESAEVIAEREKRRQRRRCPDYPGLALSSSVFSTETGMKFSIIRNELHNVLKPQLRRNLNLEPSTLQMPLLQGYEYPIDDLQPLHDLLKSWKLEFLYQTLLDELIDMQVLAVMKSVHVNELLNKFPLAIKIKFSHYLENWQNTQNASSNNKLDTILPKITKPFVQEETVVDININLSDILTSSTTGTMIIDYYKTNNKFNDNIRALLVETVISYIITTKKQMSVNLADHIGNQIIAMFPSEVKDTYFMKHEANKNPKGKIYAKFYNSMRALKTSGLIPSNAHHVKVPVKSMSRKNFEPETGIEYILDQIMHDKNCSFPDLEINWKATTNYRLNEIQKASTTTDILNKWIGYTLPLGYRLIDIDFHTLYPNCPNLVSIFEDKSEKLIDLLNEKIKDNSSRTLFESLKNSSNICQNGKNTVLFYSLHSIFVPTSKKVTKDDKGKKSLVKYSIKDSQNSFMVFKNSVCEIEEYITCRSKEKNPIQPYILIVGTPINPKEILVFFDSTKYKVFSILHAIDVCFKIFHLFNLEYPSQSIAVWIFIQKYFFSLTTKFDKPCHLLGQILSDLTNN